MPLPTPKRRVAAAPMSLRPRPTAAESTAVAPPPAPVYGSDVAPGARKILLGDGRPALGSASDYAFKERTRQYKASGSPDVDVSPDESKRPYYNPLTKRLNISPYRGAPIEEEYLAELSHARQHAQGGLVKLALGAAKGALLPDSNEAGGRYSTPGTMEYNAHREIEPTLIKQWNAADGKGADQAAQRQQQQAALFTQPAAERGFTPTFEPPMKKKMSAGPAMATYSDGANSIKAKATDKLLASAPRFGSADPKSPNFTGPPTRGNSEVGLDEAAAEDRATVKSPTYADVTPDNAPATKKMAAAPPKPANYQAAAAVLRSDKDLMAEYHAGVASGKAFSMSIGGKTFQYAATTSPGASKTPAAKPAPKSTAPTEQGWQDAYGADVADARKSSASTPAATAGTPSAKPSLAQFLNTPSNPKPARNYLDRNSAEAKKLENDYNSSNDSMHNPMARTAFRLGQKLSAKTSADEYYAKTGVKLQNQHALEDHPELDKNREEDHTVRNALGLAAGVAIGVGGFGAARALGKMKRVIPAMERAAEQETRYLAAKSGSTLAEEARAATQLPARKAPLQLGTGVSPAAKPSIALPSRSGNPTINLPERNGVTRELPAASRQLQIGVGDGVPKKVVRKMRAAPKKS